MNKKEKNKMINTYDSYVKESGAITIEQMRKMHENMMLEIGEDEDALELYDDLCNAIFPYADLRAKWHTFSIEEKMDKVKSVYLIATRDLSNLWLQFFLSQNQGFMRLFEKTVLK